MGLEYGQVPDPKGAFVRIFIVLGVFMALLFALQFADLGRAERDDTESELWREMAVAPIDEDALRARRETWGTARRSVGLGVVITILIFLSVPPIYLLDTFVPLMVGAPLIALIALAKSVGLMRPGGDLDQAYKRVSRALAPLGLRVAEHPEVALRPVAAAPLRFGARLHGALVLEGTRHGRAVRVAMPRWTGLRGRADADGVTVERRGSGGDDWLHDLRLAERLAAALE